jgi:hypothetical protein
VLWAILIVLMLALFLSCGVRIGGAAFPSIGGPRLGWMLWFGSFEVIWKGDGILRDQLRQLIRAPQLPLIYYFKPLVRTGTLGPGTVVVAVPLVYPVVLTYAAFVAVCFRDWRKTMRIARGGCRACGYPLSDGMTRCPECGTARTAGRRPELF